MKEENVQTPFSMALLTCVFVGFITSILCLLYNIIFRQQTGFPFNDIINVSSLIFSVNIFFFIIGFIYFPFVKKSQKPEILFITIFLLLIIYTVIKAESVNRSSNLLFNSEFRDLFAGIVVIVGIGIMSIPFLFHNKRFRDAVL